jgi:hypothetical protein
MVEAKPEMEVIVNSQEPPNIGWNHVGVADGKEFESEF